MKGIYIYIVVLNVTLKKFFQYREKRLEQEKELLLNQNSWLNTELKTKTDELLALGREKGNEILELKCNLENKKEEVSSKIIFFILGRRGICKFFK